MAEDLFPAPFAGRAGSGHLRLRQCAKTWITGSNLRMQLVCQLFHGEPGVYQPRSRRMDIEHAGRGYEYFSVSPRLVARSFSRQRAATGFAAFSGISVTTV